jgi:hypothetical protein
MQETPSSWTDLASLDADWIPKSSGSMRAAIRVPFFFLVLKRAFSVGPASLISYHRLGEVVDEGVVDVYVWLLGGESVFSPELAIRVTTRNYSDVIL